ncbi:MAG TPA: hypothetical protein VFW40_00910, partial [Capsulimonadaceae bacterium]|nr:hypothetical protein [Capsulimonadaceae bacterium]
MIPARRPFLASRNSRLCASLTGLCLMGLLLAGCSQNKGLVGRWAGDQTSANTTTNYEVEFRSDDTYSESIDVQMSDNSKPESSSTSRGNFTATA